MPYQTITINTPCGPEEVRVWVEEEEATEVDDDSVFNPKRVPAKVEEKV